jgi:hypothetical protein
VRKKTHGSTSSIFVGITFSPPRLTIASESPSYCIRVVKMTLLSSLLHLTNYRNPFLRTLVPSISLAYTLQAAVAVPSILAQSERFYDLSGSLTYLGCTALSLYLPTIRARAAAAATGGAKPQWPSLLASLTGGNAGLSPASALNWRHVALSAAVAIWATRR